MNAAYILLLFRKGIAYDWKSLCHALDLPFCADSPEKSTLCSDLSEIVSDLIRADLLIRKNSGSIQISPKWIQIQTALHISLETVSLLNPRAIVVEPIHGIPKKISTLKQLDLFMLMPFTEEMRPTYEVHIKNVAKRLGLNIKRADDLFTSNVVVQDIWAGICSSQIIIADCTGRNPNVFYEIGLAHVVGKRIILITQNREDVPFDLRHMRYIYYRATARGMKALELSLMKTLKSELGVAVKEKKITHCPFCNGSLRTAKAKQCRFCMRDWHDPDKIISLSPCPFCGATLRTPRAKQCRFCMRDWHDSNNLPLLNQ